jgi:hypothetical protein
VLFIEAQGICGCVNGSTNERRIKMRKQAVMVLILLGAMTILGSNNALAQGPHGHMWGEAQFDAMDTNSDGKVTRDEHMAKCENRFKAMDTNNDGFLTRDECRKVWQERKADIQEKRKERRSYRLPTGSSPQVAPEESKSTSD